MDEPTAAAIAYGNSKNENIHKTVLIYDLGGGTFDCTVMRLDFEGTDRKYQVITTGGNHQLGGKDWDAALANYVKDEFSSEYTTIKEQGLTIYIDGSNAAWVNGGVFYKLVSSGDILTKKQITAIAVSL